MAPACHSFLLRIGHVLAACAAVALAGCSATPRPRVETLGDLPDSATLSFYLTPDRTTPPQDPVFAEAAAMTRARLHALGLVESAQAGLADMAIEISWDISLPRQQVRTERALPSHIADGSNPGRPGNSLDALPRGAAGDAPPGGAPERALETHVYFEYAKSLTFVGRPPAATGTAELWRIQVSVTDTDPAITRVLPALVDAAVGRIEPGLAAPAPSASGPALAAR